MIIAYKLGIYDDGTYMIGGPTYRPTRIEGFHDWRFGKDGVPHPATCPKCGSKTDPDYINPNFRPKKRRRDINSTHDVLRHDPRFAWIVYREGADCFVQQRLSLDGSFADILPRVTTTEDGDAVSEWATTSAAVEQFLNAEPGRCT